MRPRSLRLPLYVLLAATAAPTQGPRLQYRVKPGDMWKIKQTTTAVGAVVLNGEARALSIDDVTLLTYRVRTVRADGSFTLMVEMTQVRRQTLVNGQPAEESERRAESLLLTLSRTGKLLGLSGAKHPGDSAPGKAFGVEIGDVAVLLTSSFPDRELEVGVEWDAGGNDAVFALKATGLVTLLATVNGRETADLQYRFEASGAALNAMAQQMRKVGKNATGALLISGRGVTGTQMQSFDVATGRPLEGRCAADLDLSYTIGKLNVHEEMKIEIALEPEK